MEKLKRKYLNREEENFFLVAKSFLLMVNGLKSLSNKITGPVWEEWENRGMITPGMKKSLKMVNTYLSKFIDELTLQLDHTEQRRLDKKFSKFNFKIIDDFTTQKFLRNIYDKEKWVAIDRNIFMEVLEDISGVTCVGCKKDYRGCKIYNLIDDMGIPHLGECPNCPHAADLSEFTPEQKKDYEKLVARISKNNKFYKPKE